MVFQEGKKQKNLENFFVTKKKTIFNGIQNSLLVYILKFSHKYSFNVTFDLSWRLKMFSSSSNVCDKKKIIFLNIIAEPKFSRLLHWF